MFFTKADIKIEVRLITDDAEKELILVLTELLWKLQERAEVPFLGWDNPEHTTPITFKDSFPIKLKDLWVYFPTIILQPKGRLVYAKV